MKYFAVFDDGGNLISVGKTTAPLNQPEITEAEYHAYIAMMEERADYINRLYFGEITIDDVPEEWREYVQAAVDEMNAAQDDVPDPEEISDAEALAIIQGVAE